MIHLGKNTRSTIISKGISAGKGQNSYRGLVQVGKNATDARLYPVRFAADRQPLRRAHFSLYRGKNPSSQVEHEATTSKIGRTRFFTATPAASKRRTQ